jgi:prepilin-type N-terminal cleavage/methylation domain-containing protein
VKAAMKKDTDHSPQQNGFTLIELMVSMFIFLIVVTTIYGLMQVGLFDRNRASRRTDIMKNARAALHLIGRDALNAGLSYNRSGATVPDNFISTRLGLPADADTDRDLLTGIIAGNDLFSNVLQADPNSRTDSIAFAYRDVSFKSGNVISLNNAAASPSSASTVRLQTKTNDAAQSNLFDLYLLESDSSQVAVMATGLPGSSNIDIGPGDPLGLNQALDGVGADGSILKKCTATITENCTTYVASMKRFFWVSYKVKADGTLVRTIFGNNSGGSAAQIQEMPLAYNIEDLQFRYVLEDGTTSENPAAGPDGVAGTDDDRPGDFNLVRQIIVTIKVQATENDEQTNQPATVTLTSTFSTRNLEYDAG